MSLLDLDNGIVRELSLGAVCGVVGRGQHAQYDLGLGHRPARFRQAGIDVAAEDNHFVDSGNQGRIGSVSFFTLLFGPRVNG